jgi:hypothetical protein
MNCLSEQRERGLRLAENGSERQYPHLRASFLKNDA